MKPKHLLFIIGFIFCSCPHYSFSQRWDTVGKKINRIGNQGPNIIYSDSVYLYMAGNFDLLGNLPAKGIARWNGVKWDSLGAGIDGLDTLNAYSQNTWALAKYHNKLYAGGAFSSLGKVKAPRVGTWDGNTWDSIPIQPFKSSDDYSLSCITAINNKLYIGGIFDTVAGSPCIGIAYWNDTDWSSLNFPNLPGYFAIDAICEYNGDIYAGGEFYGTPGDSSSNILRWDGKHWLSVGGGIPGGAIEVQTMTVYKGELYVAGYFSKSEGDVGNYIQKWNGSSWSEVGGGVLGPGGGNGQIFQLLVYKNKLYAMGVFQTAGGVSANRIASWDGIEWCSLGSTFDNSITTGCMYKDSLYIGGGFWTIDGDSIVYIAEWVGGNYVDTCGVTGINELNTESEGVKVFPNPSDGKFTIEEQGVRYKEQVEVYNMLGEKVASSNSSEGGGINSLLSGVHTGWAIDLQGQPAGIYLYRITSEKGELVGSGKLVIE